MGKNRGVPAVGGFWPEARASWGKCQLGEVPVRVSASWGKCQLGDFNLSDFLGTFFILIHFYRCTGSWGTLAWGEGQLGEVPVGGVPVGGL